MQQDRQDRQLRQVFCVRVEHDFNAIGSVTCLRVEKYMLTRH